MDHCATASSAVKHEKLLSGLHRKVIMRTMSSISANDGKSKRRRHPPPRLAWPTRKLPAEEETLEVVAERHPISNKRPRRVTLAPKKAKSNPSGCRLWSEKYAPQSSKELAVSTKKVEELTAWLQNSSNKLLVLIGSPGIGKSSMIRCLATELEIDLKEYSEPLYSSADNDPLSPIDMFQQFLQQNATGLQSLQLVRQQMQDSSKLTQRRSVIVLDELPNLHGKDAHTRFREVLSTHVQSTVVPTVLVYSNTVGGKARPNCLESLVDCSLLHSPFCRILQINNPTKSKFTKIIQHVLACEGLRSKTFNVEELRCRSDGDLRFAINTLQCEQTGQRGVSAVKIKDVKKTRDTKLSSFHALGKLLYAKRQNVSQSTPSSEDRSPLEFDPESVIAASDMEVSSTSEFLAYHCVDFFTDIEDLSTAFDHFSDASLFLRNRSGNATPWESSISTQTYAGSLASRAVANANKHPAANKFRQFDSPKVFGVFQKRLENRARISKICVERRYRKHQIAASVSSLTFAVDLLPFRRKILPDHYMSSSFLRSHFDSGQTSKTQQLGKTSRAPLHNIDVEADRTLKEQAAILNEDDIIEDEF